MLTIHLHGLEQNIMDPPPVDAANRGPGKMNWDQTLQGGKDKRKKTMHLFKQQKICGRWEQTQTPLRYQEKGFWEGLAEAGNCWFILSRSAF